MRYAVKLIDFLIQALVFATVLFFLLLFSTEGYFYWGIVALALYGILSSVLHLALRFPISSFRIIVWVVYGILLLLLGGFWVAGHTFAQLNAIIYPGGIPDRFSLSNFNYFRPSRIQTRRERLLGFLEFNHRCREIPSRGSLF